MTIIGLDQSTKLTGYSIYKDGVLQRCGVIDTNIKNNNPIERMERVHDKLSALFQVEKPEFVALEGVQYQNSMHVYSQLSQLQGVIFSLLFEKNIGFQVIEPSAWRIHFGIKSNRKRNELKSAAIQVVSERYGLDVSEDAAEAVLIGQWLVDILNQNA